MAATDNVNIRSAWDWKIKNKIKNSHFWIQIDVLIIYGIQKPTHGTP
jgi:hypothetical protein